MLSPLLVCRVIHPLVGTKYSQHSHDHTKSPIHTRRSIGDGGGTSKTRWLGVHRRRERDTQRPPIPPPLTTCTGARHHAAAGAPGWACTGGVRGTRDSYSPQAITSPQLPLFT